MITFLKYSLNNCQFLNILVYLNSISYKNDFEVFDEDDDINGPKINYNIDKEFSLDILDNDIIRNPK